MYVIKGGPQLDRSPYLCAEVATEALRVRRPQPGQQCGGARGSTQRARYPNLLAAIREHPGATHTSPPPDENPAWYISEGGQWRKDPVGRWGWKREGIHAILGALSGLLIVAALFGQLPQGLAMGTVGIMSPVSWPTRSPRDYASAIGHTATLAGG